MIGGFGEFDITTDRYDQSFKYVTIGYGLGVVASLTDHVCICFLIKDRKPGTSAPAARN